MPKPHTPFQWAAPARPRDAPTPGWPSCATRSARDRRYGKAIGFRYHDGKPGIVEGLLSRGDRRVGAVIRKVWEDGGRFDGWSEHFSFDRWMRCADEALAGEPVDVAWYTTRERDVDEVLPWDHLDSGLDKDWLWEDWQDALSEVEVEDCRWTPCFDCGVCPQMGTEIQVGPTGRTHAAADGRPVRHGRDRGLTPQSNDQGKVGDHGHDPQLFLDRCRTGGQRRVTWASTTGRAPAGTVATCRGPRPLSHIGCGAAGQ